MLMGQSLFYYIKAYEIEGKGVRTGPIEFFYGSSCARAKHAQCLATWRIMQQARHPCEHNEQRYDRVTITIDIIENRHNRTNGIANIIICVTTERLLQPNSGQSYSKTSNTKTLRQNN